MNSLKKLLGVFVFTVTLILCVPSNVKAAEMSDEFRTYLNKDGKLVVNSVRVESGIEFVFEYLFVMDENGEYLDNGICWDIAEDMNSVDFTIHCWEEDKKETHNVEIVYTYDEKIKSQVDGYLNKIPEDLEYFEVNDLEVINYWVNGGNIIDYSSQLKSLFDYKNFKMDFRAGGGDRFIEDAMGNAQFMYNGTVYGIRENTGVSAKHVIYIDESVGNTKEEIVKAVQKRIDDYLGKGKVTVEFAFDNVYDSFIEAYDGDIAYYQEEFDKSKEAYELAQAKETEFCITNYNEEKCWEAQNERSLSWMIYNNNESYLNYNKQYKETFIKDWNDPNSNIAFLKNAVNNWSFAAYVHRDEEVSEIYEFVVIRDSSKMVNPSVKTSDVATNVEISTSATLPLDTTIQANKLTSGTEYERILEILNLTDNLTFDLKLYSDSIDEYITKLDDGAFEVKIPIPNDFKEKDLVVYYVKDNGDKEVYQVEVKDNYALFKTNHFSIYTLGYTEITPEPVKVIFDANGGKFGSENTYTINDWTADMYDGLTKPTRDGYTFKGYFTEKTGGTKFEMILNEAGIDDGAVFYAQWEENSGEGEVMPEEKNPQTGDNIASSIIVGISSLIVLIGSIVYLNKRNKLRAN